MSFHLSFSITFYLIPYSFLSCSIFSTTSTHKYSCTTYFFQFHLLSKKGFPLSRIKQRNKGRFCVSIRLYIFMYISINHPQLYQPSISSYLVLDCRNSSENIDHDKQQATNRIKLNVPASYVIFCSFQALGSF